jgi:hypothetical protein
MKTGIRPILIAITLLFPGFLARVQGVIPAPDGCYPNYTTAEACNALSFLSTGAGNTALGWCSLFLDSNGSFNAGIGGGALALNNADSNTAVGAGAMLLDATGTENTAVGTDGPLFNDSRRQPVNSHKNLYDRHSRSYNREHARHTSPDRHRRPTGHDEFLAAF